jgi:protein-tyrosine phosphatase
MIFVKPQSEIEHGFVLDLEQTWDEFLGWRPTGRKVGVVSITDVEAREAKIPCRPNDTFICRVKFDDDVVGRLCITDADAKRIADFFHQNNSRVTDWVVHCRAGRCRSAAVAAAFAVTMGQSDEEFWREPFSPNELVYDKVLAALGLNPFR